MPPKNLPLKPKSNSCMNIMNIWKNITADSFKRSRKAEVPNTFPQIIPTVQEAANLVGFNKMSFSPAFLWKHRNTD